MKTVRRYVAPFRQALAAPEPGPAVPKTRQITRWLLTRPDRLRPEEQEQLGQITERCPHIQALAGYVTSFAEMMTGRTGSQDLEAWLTAIEADDGQPDLRSLATGIRNDQQAVINGLTDLPRAFRTADLWLIHAADCCSRYSSWTCCGVRY